MEVSIIVLTFHEFIIDVHSFPTNLKELITLLIVTIVESTVSDAKVGLDIMSVRVFSITFKYSEGSNEVSLFEEMGNIWEFILFLTIITKSNKLPASE